MTVNAVLKRRDRAKAIGHLAMIKSYKYLGSAAIKWQNLLCYITNHRQVLLLLIYGLPTLEGWKAELAMIKSCKYLGSATTECSSAGINTTDVITVSKPHLLEDVDEPRHHLWLACSRHVEAVQLLRQNLLYYNTNNSCTIIQFFTLYSRLAFGPGTDQWSHITTHLVVLAGATPSKKCYGSIISNRIGMKFGRIVPQVNMHWPTVSDLQFDVTFSSGHDVISHRKVLPPGEWTQSL